MSILLTLAMQSMNSLIEKGEVQIEDLPNTSSEKLDLRGIVVDADHLAGWSLDMYDKFRNFADKANSPCLLVRDNTVLEFGGKQSEDSVERIRRLSVAANRLGCNAIAITPHFPKDEQIAAHIIEQLRSTMQYVERLELNLLLQPSEGMTSEPDSHIDIIKQVGGFRIGALPTFSAAIATGDGIGALQKLAPYAGAIIADFPTGRGKKAMSLEAGLQAVIDVGYSNTIALNYTGSGNPMPQLTKASKALYTYLEAGE